MNEPDRIGLTPLVAEQLDELLSELNPNIESTKETVKLIKFDIYRLAVSLGLKERKSPPELKEKSNSAFRVGELDRDKALFTVVECLECCPNDTSIYRYIERLAEQGIQEFYQEYQQRGELPLTEYFSDKS